MGAPPKTAAVLVHAPHPAPGLLRHWRDHASGWLCQWSPHILCYGSQAARLGGHGWPESTPQAHEVHATGRGV
jgi:hypothetical protein